MTKAVCASCKDEIKGEDYSVSNEGILCASCAASKAAYREDRSSLQRLSRTCFLAAAFSTFALDLFLVAAFALFSGLRFGLAYRAKAARPQGAPSLPWHNWAALAAGLLLAASSLLNQVSQLSVLMRLYGS